MKLGFLYHDSFFNNFDEQKLELVKSESSIFESTVIEKGLLTALLKSCAKDALKQSIQDSEILIKSTWSQQFLEENPGSRWITYHGNRILIRGNPDGTASVVFSANPAMEHLKIIPKTHEQYEELKQKLNERKSVRNEEEFTPEQLQQEKNLQQEKKDLLQKNKSEYLNNIKAILNIGEVIPEAEVVDGRKIDKKLVDKVQDVVSKIENKSEGVEDFAQKLKELEEENKINQKEKEKIVEALQQKVEDTIINKAIDDMLGEGVEKPEKKQTKTGNDEVDKLLDKIELSDDDAFKLAEAKEKFESGNKEIQKSFKTELKKITKKVELTSLQGVGIIDWDKPLTTTDELTEKVLNKLENRIRTKKNSQFYDVLDLSAKKEGRTKASIKFMKDGAGLAMNAISNLTNGDISLSNDLIDFLGVTNSARLIASRIDKLPNSKEVKQQLEEYVAINAKNIVSSSLDNAKEALDRVGAYTEMCKDDIIATSTMNARKAQQLGQLAKKVSLAAGSLEASAAIIDSLNNKDYDSDILIDGGNNEVELLSNLKRLGLNNSNFKIKKELEDGKNKYFVTISLNNFDKIAKSATQNFERDEQVREIKNLKEATGFRAKGVPDHYFEFKTPEEFNSLPSNEKDGYEKYKNKKGQDGYTSLFDEGKEMYRKKMPAFTMAIGQEQAFKMLMAKNRVLADLGAGIGKTYLFLSATSQLKAEGKLEGSFAFVSPPSRLVDEFLKDQQKHFPHLNVLILDKIRDDKNGSARENRLRALKEASEGKYDLVLSGHDTIKGGTTPEAIAEYIEAKENNFINQLKENGNNLPSKADFKILREKWGKEARQSVNLAAEVASFNPAFVGVDEAHEAFKEIKFDKKGNPISSARFEAMKTLSKKSEYFMPATGTTVRNTIGEMISLAHIVRPDVITDPAKLAKKYENMGQGTTMFQEQSVNEFRKIFDDLMISASTEVKGAQKHQKINKLQLTAEQKNQYKKVEAQYRIDRDNADSYAIRSKKNGDFKLDDDGDYNSVVIHDEVPFEIGKDAAENQDVDAVENEEKSSSGARYQSPAEKKWLKQQGINPDDFEVVQLGIRNGAASRRDSRHNKNINGGNWKNNTKAISISDKINLNDNSKHIIHYEVKDSLKMMKDCLMEKNGLKPEQIVFVDGSLSKPQRKETVTKFQTDPNVKVILLSNAGATGLNLQKGDIQHFLSRKQTYALQQQSEARSYRTGRKGDVEVNYYDTNTPYDHSRVDNIEKKRKTTELVGDYQEKMDLASQMEKLKQMEKGFITINGITIFKDELLKQIEKSLFGKRLDLFKTTRSNLAKKTITNKNGKTTTIWVNTIRECGSLK